MKRLLLIVIYVRKDILCLISYSSFVKSIKYSGTINFFTSTKIKKI